MESKSFVHVLLVFKKQDIKVEQCLFIDLNKKLSGYKPGGV